jgi:hypothetical protein
MSKKCRVPRGSLALPNASSGRFRWEGDALRSRNKCNISENTCEAREITGLALQLAVTRIGLARALTFCRGAL